MYTFQDITKQAEWDRLITSDNHYFEAKLVINNIEYSESRILKLNTEWMVYDEEPTVGGCYASELETKIIAPTDNIPKMAQVKPYVRVTNGTSYSEWMPQGVYYIDTREVTKNDDGLDIMTLHCYDAMLKTEADYPDTEGEWPKTDTQVVNQIASVLGVSVDSRTQLNQNYLISAPIGYTMRETLSNIGSMYAGNWVMTLEGKLLMVSINGIPKETNLLVDGAGNIITFGEDAISLVDTV